MENLLATYLEPEDGDTERFLDQLAVNEKMSELGRLTAGIVHELNTPLSVIVSAAQLILRERDVPEYVAELVERIGVEAQRLAQLTRGILSFAGNGGGSCEADINDVLREVMTFLKYEAQKRSITVTESLDYSLPAITTDSNRLKQIFINLIMNALQAMEGGGNLKLQTTWGNGRAEIVVADSGPGIPVEHLHLIFDPFFTTKAPEKGTGLGLYITKRLTESLGGDIRVNSTPGRGATFVISFPLSST
ncbi:sensor histidine kinase [Geobacter sp. DSM 9736]|uniref:sensor histidine kinase n=1 Tax=Geobacter sp. DSM 9736 TaxID=1277350 RepID=UPI000B5012C7|nr:HAMP domain-containing sensor histidine kinase [Geobacter sp. DSM 9736]SNB45195.1 hypothetical protein/two-component system, NtrC family, sensor kinase [Geobacter sp. DSM 9736]